MRRFLGVFTALVLFLALMPVAGAHHRPGHPIPPGHQKTTTTESTTTTTSTPTTTTTVAATTTTTVAATTTTVAPTTTTTAPTTTTTTGSCDTTVQPGSSIQSAVTSQPAGATICIAEGTHILDESIIPKNGQRFVGIGEAIINGNGEARQAVIAWGSNGGTIDNLIFEHFDTQAIQGGTSVVQVGSGWTITNTEIRDNTGMGVFHERDTVLRGNNIHHNGHSGIGGFKAHRSVIEDNHVWANGALLVGGQSAGAKWVGGIDLIVRNNHFEDNGNNGLWLDADNVNALVEGNLIERTNGKGLHFEANCSGELRGNTVVDNTIGVFLIASSNVDFHDNTIIGSTDEAIRVYQWDRGQGENCYWSLGDNHIVNNVFSGGRVRVIEQDIVGGSIFDPADNRVFFDFNTYQATTFQWDGQTLSFAEWQAVGNDTNSTFD